MSVPDISILQALSSFGGEEVNFGFSIVQLDGGLELMNSMCVANVLLLIAHMNSMCVASVLLLIAQMNSMCVANVLLLIAQKNAFTDYGPN